MKKSKMKNNAQAYEETLGGNKDKYVLRLYVAGFTPQSSRAILRIKELCEKHMKGFHTLEIIDIYQQPELARQEQIIAAPTLVKKLPLPLRKFIGDLTNAENLIKGLDLRRVDS